MVAERPTPILTGIHINLVDHVVTLEAQDGRRAQLSFVDSASILAAQDDTPPALETEADVTPPASELPTTENRERQHTSVIRGRLRTKPKEGKPDTRGNPTAWARLAVHEEGSDTARLYSATFHRKTAEIALGLSRGAQLTVEGYSHAGDPEQKRMDTFSVIAVHQYPGKPERRRAVNGE